MESFQITKTDWQKALQKLNESYTVYAPVSNGYSIDYEIIGDDNINDIIYNTPKPVTPLKTFFLPVKSNVVINRKIHKKNVIMGIPSCDLAGVDLLDKIYLDKDFIDPYYRDARENSILIGTDCFSKQEHCHCTAYGVNPYPEKNNDLSLISLNGAILIFVNTDKGAEIVARIKEVASVQEISSENIKEVRVKREAVKKELKKGYNNLPDYKETGKLVRESNDAIWEKYARTCVSCGACATICPTCTCFLLIDRPDFEKVRQLDACQYPGFERIAAGEDPLGKKFVRFRNRYLCKYVWKPEKFESIACTGCGRCIESCIGNINKNELFTELVNKK
jgi:sulfhydrogenase subunit beta (sulfur reductase)